MRRPTTAIVNICMDISNRECVRYVHPKTRLGRKNALNKGPANHTGFGHVDFDAPLHIDPYNEITDLHLEQPGIKFDERDPREHPKHPQHEEHRKEGREKIYRERQKMRACVRARAMRDACVRACVRMHACLHTTKAAAAAQKI